MESNTFDVLVVGAGISGINAAYRLQTQCPDKQFVILENRLDMGGTWDLFKYPGIRSDSDLFTFGFAWRPWEAQQSIASGESIKKYIKESAQMYDIDKKIRYGHRVVRANWTTDQQLWRLEVEVHDEEWNVTETKAFFTNFLIFGTGYYDYEVPLSADIPGIDDFEGVKVHPQFWPKDLDYTNKKVVIIGSGATAVTLLPIIAETAEKVTMLQRSPGYIVAMPSLYSPSSWIRRLLPLWLAHEFTRLRFVALSFFFFNFCRMFPKAAKRGLKRRTEALLPPHIPYAPHFQPSYNPWEQRLCVCPEGDFFKALNKGKADVATGHIKEVRKDSILLESGQEIPADVIVTATGLKLRIAGGTQVSVDGIPYNFNDNFVWRGVLLQRLPNAAIVMGYTMASWTLGADAAARHVCRILNFMSKRRHTSVVPTIEEPVQTAAGANNLKSTYLIRGRDAMPKAGDKAPWQARSNYFIDMWHSRRGDLAKGLRFFSLST